MIEETFYSMFVEKLRNVIKALPEQKIMNTWAQAVYQKEWHPFDRTEQPKAAVVACDGSVNESAFGDGLSVCVTRAVAHIYSEKGGVDSVPDVGVDIGYELAGQSLMMKALELRTLARAMRTANQKGSVFAVYDGTLYFTLPTHYLPHLLSMVGPIERYVKALTECLETAQAGGVSLVGLSKDSKVTYLRAMVLLEALEKADPEAGGELRPERSLHRMARVLGEIVEERQMLNQPTRLLEDYLEEFNRPSSDEGVYSELAMEPGFTTPLVLGPQTQFLTEQIGRGRMNWWDSAFRRDLQKDQRFAQLLAAFDKFYECSPIAVSYWKPRREIGCYRVDVPSNLLTEHVVKAGNIEGNAFANSSSTTAIQPLLAGMSALSSPPNIVTPLTEVDVIVRLDRKLFKDTYEPVIIGELQRSGFKVRTKRRSIRDMVMRGY